ncbi:MAG: hypothetical protein AMXMBFR44_2810 [Candidatus Campbellbacteria bacterium]
MNAHRNKNRFRFGFTVVEMLFGIALLIVLGLVLYAFQKDVFSINRVISESLTAQNEARRGLKMMSAEIRSASPSSLGAYALSETSSSSIAFYRNVDDDQLKEHVRYFLDGTILKKGITKPTGSPLTYNPGDEVVTEFIHDVANGTTSVFAYYDDSYDGTTDPLSDPVDISTVRLAKITIVIDKDAQEPPGAITLTTQVSMRNLKDNL